MKKRILALLLSLAIIATMLPAAALAELQTPAEARIITAITPLSQTVASQQLSLGATEADITLPDTLEVTRRRGGRGTSP